MAVTGADLTFLPYYRDPAIPGIEREAARQSRWLQPYDDPRLYPQEGDRMIATGMRRAQYMIFRHPARDRIVATGRRFGKTDLNVHEMLRKAQTGFRREIAYVAPTLKDAKRLMWLKLKQMTPRHMIGETNSTSLSLTIRGFESRIRLFGADRPESIYGEGLDFLVIDEAQSVPANFFQQYARPTLIDKQGELLLTFRPEGFNWVFDRYLEAENPDNADAAAFSFTTLDGENVKPSEIDRERHAMDPGQFAQEYEASFTNPRGRVYVEFSRQENVSAEARDLGGPVLVGLDFNVSPMSAVFASVSDDGRLFVWGELEEFGSHTQEVAQKIKRLFPDRPIVVYPDPSGRQRSAAAQGLTSFHLLAQAGFRVIAPSRTPKVRDRIATLMAMFRNAAGVRRLLINHKCRQTIRSIEALSYGENGEPQKDSGFDHLPDALGYLTWSLFPLIKYQTGMARLVG